ncbi:MAG: hypothetical protein CMJ20_13230 [Phycisphaeraceae bacterium]|nr:hypothetical protein [Phycisphaeraceae bacterium]
MRLNTIQQRQTGRRPRPEHRDRLRETPVIVLKELHMNRLFPNHWRLMVIWVVVTVLAWTWSPLVPAATDNSLTASAVAGRFHNVLTSLRINPQIGDIEDVENLIYDLERHEEHRQTWLTSRRQDFDHVMQEMVALLEVAHLIEDALTFAIDAQDLATNAKTFLEDPRVVLLVKKSQAAAKRAERAGDWLTMARLHQLLDLLFNDPAATHHEIHLRAQRHVRVVRLYTPVQYKQMAEQRAKRRGEHFDPQMFREYMWQERLGGITKTMLDKAIDGAERHHIESTHGYGPLLIGAIDALMILLDTRGLEAEFPGLRQLHKVDLFRSYLQGKKNEIQQVTHGLNSIEAKQLIKMIIQTNRETVDLDERVLYYEMTEGAVQTLDKFTSVIWPYDADHFFKSTKGKFYGVGIQISMSLGPLTVQDLPPNSQAIHAGLQAGDVIVKINGHTPTGYSAGYVSWRIQHDRGSKIRLEIERTGNSTPIEIVLDHGLKLNVRRPRGELTVKSPLRGTPAYRADLRADDKIVSVNGQSTEDWTLERAVREITGDLDTLVTLGIKRGQKILKKDIRRAQIEIESIRGWQLEPDDTWNYYIDSKRRIGYVRLSQFIPRSETDLDLAINQMRSNRGLDALILDLRFNPGGLLKTAIDVTNRFLAKGLIVSTIDAEGNQTSARNARPDFCHPQIPLVILINQTSASASEIVSGALQDHNLATIVGVRSYGKGSVQDLFAIATNDSTSEPSAMLKLTTHYYCLPSGSKIHRRPRSSHWGVEPDLEVKMTDGQVRRALERRQDLDVLRKERLSADSQSDAGQILENGIDPQLEAALLILKTQLVADRLTLAQNTDSTVAP